MDARLRFVPLAGLVALLTARTFRPDLLASPVHEGWPIHWYWVAFTLLLSLTAVALAKPFTRLVNLSAKNWLVGASVMLALGVGIVWSIDVSWNEFVRPWCSMCPESRLLPALTAAAFGGSP